ncbi:hypothetical protein BU15DRAFT_70739 [Melanogaster broomeanus]|nr:hypothetical protein BU15DRAFT_70739 [Melanogaster broomeanus]
MLSLAVGRVVLPSTPRLFTRAYVVSLEPSVVHQGKPTPRRYTERKTFLYNQYTHMLKASENAPIIFLQHKDFSARRLQILRREIDLATLDLPFPLIPQPPLPVLADPPKLSIMRTSILGVVLRDFAPLDAEKTTQIAKLVDGGLAVLTLPSFNPPQLNAIIRAMDRAVPPSRHKGRRWKPVPRVKPIMTPELKVMGALIEGRVFSAAGVTDVAKLPTLDTLRAQIVGLLSSPAMQLAAVLSEASGGKLARTLEGLKKGLEEGH